MIDRINTLRTVAKNLTSHLILEGKTQIKKPAAIIPGAVAAAGVAVMLETKDNEAKLVVQKGDKELQSASFSYNDTPNGYELVSASSTYFYDNKDKKEFHQSHYLIEPEREAVYEHYINYANAPMKKTTREYIDKINAAVVQVAGYKSDKTDYDSQESHTYGKKSLRRDIPALLKFMEIIAPDSEFTLKMKDKLKKDNKTSLLAFEVNDAKNGNEIIKGFLSANGDSVSYRLNTEDITIIGEQGENTDFSRTYLKPEKTAEQQDVKDNVPKEEPKEETPEQEPVTQSTPAEKPQPKKETKEQTAEVKKSKENKTPAKTDTDKKTGKTENKDVKNKTAGEVPLQEQTQAVTDNMQHVHPKDYYIASVLKTAKSKMTRSEKAKVYKDILAKAYADGYDRSDLDNIFMANGRLDFSNYCRKVYIDTAIDMVESGGVKPAPAKTTDDKIDELKNIRIDTRDEDLKFCVQNMIGDFAKIKDETVKAAVVDKALNLLNNKASKNFNSELLSFVQETAKINDDMNLHYEIYNESVSNNKVKALKTQIEQMINNIAEAHHEQRGEFLTKLYITQEINELEALQNEIQKLLNVQFSHQVKDGNPQIPKQPKKLLIEALSGTNQKIVRKLLTCKSPSDISLAFSEIRNLLLDMGFTEGNVKGTHHKFIPPLDILFNGKKQMFLTIAYQKTKAPNPAQIDDLINVCKQYYGEK